MTTPLPAKAFTLATDLDGTFLGGTTEDRQALYDWIERHRESVRLVFVSGRDPMFITDLCESGSVPWPEFVIGDVGTTIAQVANAPEGGKRIETIPALEHQIAHIWDNRGEPVRKALANAKGLSLQLTPFRYRVSYDFDPESYDGQAEKIVADMGLDVLISDNRFFDVLPPGVSKGPSLLRFLKHMGIAHDSVLVAGDTLNDLSMFQTGLQGAVVGGSEPELLSATADLPNSRHCTAIGAAGIAEAISAFNLHPQASEAQA
ncbi:HAD-IIB family hydrolase [Pontivivens insulae]|uniref:Mannosylfructose-phosphate phosphatase n=1 Tax=Pontivivens insulae TaxID=1639689 RepID=A0A2R8AC18_9RHOB|nr:HAD-IIB family hydrolase [Pontivivens insulae]RED11022.1 HAD superfamily hydrolase (TIGR01484 family) [Pontivivens insulae]SPF29803.1 Mannosylfructose-phosphate phosphatase [Pontivivens insulae]